MTDVVVAIEFAGEILALTRAELDAARARARDLGLSAQSKLPASDVEPLVDSTRMGEIAGVPRSHIDELARRHVIPSVEIGKYRRYRASEVLAAFKTNLGAKPNDHASNTRQRRVAG